ncbi:unnamed protein product [Linum tenue]|uniref:Uncharacterized protein n=1 Tax=Linum tenue TaxID=586396 RepID=A0AAV0NT54_9ROSI|nr:unnamed protein product [Linum tenue]
MVRTVMIVSARDSHQTSDMDQGMDGRSVTEYSWRWCAEGVAHQNETESEDKNE